MKEVTIMAQSVKRVRTGYANDYAHLHETRLGWFVVHSYNCAATVRLETLDEAMSWAKDQRSRDIQRRFTLRTIDWLKNPCFDLEKEFNTLRHFTDFRKDIGSFQEYLDHIKRIWGV